MGLNTPNNVGAGSDLILTMAVDTTSTKDFTQTDLDNGLTACVVSANGEIGMGSAGDKLFGAVVGVGPDENGDNIPDYCQVAVRGVHRFLINGTAPAVGQMVEVDGAGKVRIASADADIAAGGHLARGQVINVSGTTYCDVFLG